MKYIGILISIIIAWAVRGLCGWLYAKFGTEIDPATQAEMINWVTAGAIAGLIAGVELFERFMWPAIKARIKKWWSNKFPPTVQVVLLLSFLFAAAVASCGTLGKVTLGVGLGNGLCAQVAVEWDDKTTTTETVKSDKADVTIDAAVDAIAVKVDKKPVKTTIVSYSCDPNTEVSD